LRFADLFGLALAALARQKVRTALTMLGVVIGTFALVTSIAVGRGVKQAILREFSRNDSLRKIEVYGNYEPKEADIPPEELEVRGEMSDEKRERIRRVLIRRWIPKNDWLPQTQLTADRLRELAEIEHVDRVVPQLHASCRAVFGGHTEELLIAVSIDDGDRQFWSRIVAGQLPPSEHGSLVVHELLPYLWGYPGDRDVANVVGQKVRVEFPSRHTGPTRLGWLLRAADFNPSEEEVNASESALKRLAAVMDKLELSTDESDALTRLLGHLGMGPDPEAEKKISDEFLIAGVVREASEAERKRVTWLGGNSFYAELFLPPASVQEFFGRSPQISETGFHSATITVDREENLKGVIAKVEELGFRQYSLEEFVRQVRANAALVTFAMAFLATVALLVSAIGITNTMLMSVLERTHEIGVMKAVGARDSDVQLIFLVEGAAIGLIGGGLGLLFSWLASFPGDSIARSMVEREMQTTIEGTLFLFPTWLTIGIVVFSGLVTTLAAVYPARRAARVDPVTALRHE
jgi:putative ABC transport system permease protein